MVYTDPNNLKNVQKTEKINNFIRPQSNLKKLTNSTLYESSLKRRNITNLAWLNQFQKKTILGKNQFQKSRIQTKISFRKVEFRQKSDLEKTTLGKNQFQKRRIQTK